MTERRRLLYTKVFISGGHPEKIMNMLADSGIAFTGSVSEADGVQVFIKSRRMKVARRLCEESGYEFKEVSVGKITAAVRRLRRRRVLVFGLIPCAVFLWFSSMYVWEIEVDGNKTVSDGRIMRELDELGIKIGTCRIGIDQYRISNEMLMRIPELSWLTLNTFGSRLEVCVREEVPMPDIVKISDPADLVAGRSGIIDSMTVLAGAATVKRGDMVDKGQILVSSGTPDILGGVRYEHSTGEIMAWTHYEISACTPLNAFLKSYTGAEYSHRTLNFFTRRINLYFISGNLYTFCDRIILYKNVHLPGGTVLPFGSSVERGYEYKPILTPLNAEAAERWLCQRLHDRLASVIDGDIKSENFLSEEKDGVITVTLRAVCLENIAVTVPAGAD